jgi:hypothetical protein
VLTTILPLPDGCDSNLFTINRCNFSWLFAGCKAGLLFVTAFSTREIMRSFLTYISWETEVWIAEDPEHLIHFDGERFLGPYPDVMGNADRA